MNSTRSDALVFFGATGDLAFKKIFPALQAMAKRGNLNVLMIGVPRFARFLFTEVRKTNVNFGEGRDQSGALREEWTHVFDPWKQTAFAPETSRSHGRWPGPKNACGWLGKSARRRKNNCLFFEPSKFRTLCNEVLPSRYQLKLSTLCISEAVGTATAKPTFVCELHSTM